MIKIKESLSLNILLLFLQIIGQILNILPIIPPNMLLIKLRLLHRKQLQTLKEVPHFVETMKHRKPIDIHLILLQLHLLLFKMTHVIVQLDQNWPVNLLKLLFLLLLWQLTHHLRIHRCPLLEVSHHIDIILLIVIVKTIDSEVVIGAVIDPFPYQIAHIRILQTFPEERITAWISDESTNPQTAAQFLKVSRQLRETIIFAVDKDLA